MEIQEKYTKLLGKRVYNKRLDKYGYISCIRVVSAIGVSLGLFAFYDSFDSSSMLVIEDFKRGNAQFVFLTDEICNGVYSVEKIPDIKDALGDKFREDMIIYMSDDEWKEHIREQDKRNTQMLHNDLVSLTDISAEVFSENFYCRELYLKFKRDVITETEMLYAIVNYLSLQYKRVNDSNRDYFFKYEALKET